MDKKHYDEMANCVEDLIQSGRFNGGPVYMFGHCNATEDTCRYLQKRGITVTALLDNNKSKQGAYYRGIPITPPDIFLEDNRTDAVVLIASRAYSAMVRQLKDLAYHGKIYKIVDYNTFEDFSLSPSTFLCKMRRVERGLSTLQRIKEAYENTFLVICPYNALGDVYHALAFLPYCLQRMCIHKYAVCVAGQACAQVADLFGIKNIEVFDQQDMDELVQAILCTGASNVLITHHDRPYTNLAIRLLDTRLITFCDFYRCGVYGLPQGTPAARPTNTRTFLGKAQLKKGRSVIISPYAKSLVQLPDSYWEAVASNYNRRGYQTFTNVASQEAPVKGTVPLAIPINEIISAVEYAGHFIGIRSGLCDVLSSADCVKTVVFPDCYYSSTKWKVHEFFALPDWNQIIAPDLPV